VKVAKDRGISLTRGQKNRGNWDQFKAD